MVRARRVVKQPKPKKATHNDGDDPAAYEDMPVPDKRSSTYVEDEIAEFHSKKISNLLAKGVQADSDQEDIADEEEVMALEISDTDEEDDEDEEEEAEEEVDMESDLEGKKDDDLPNEMAWGRRKKIFYDSDYVAAKKKSQEEAAAEDEEEEEEAKNIQRRLVGNLSEEDYDLHLLQAFTEVPEEAGKPAQKEKIVKDLGKMSHKEKLKLLKKESPELLELIQDFKAKLAELRDEIQPLLDMVSDGRIPEGKGADFLRTKQQLYLNYCTNISFYLVLKAKRVPAQNHPVIERLVCYRNLINDLGQVDARLAPQMRQLLSESQLQDAARKPVGSKHASAPGRSVTVMEDSGAEAESESESESESDLDEEAALRFYREQEALLKQKKGKQQPEEAPEPDEDEFDPEGKRGITYQMAKNKGLTPKRKKIDRNPRVKHREKFRRAKIRRKGQVREVRKEEQRYSGEWSGIRAGVIKSTKFK